MSSMKVKFWGVRGSVPTPLTHDDVCRALRGFLHELPDGATRDDAIKALGIRWAGNRVFAHGGNTSCVTVEAGEELVVLDMGTGLRELGNALIGQAVKEKRLRATFLLSHVHWDHIQGLPFFKPLYLNKHDRFLNDWTFYGGTEWYKRAEECLRGQMDAPSFPVSFREIEQLTERMVFETVHDGLVLKVHDHRLQAVDPTQLMLVECHKLDHPQETYGYRISFGGKVVAYTTDHEPRMPDVPYRNLLKLIQDADLWITDCQYSQHQYEGKSGPQRFGWGHSYPTAIAAAASQANVKRVVTFHHEPDNDAAAIERIATDVSVILSSRITVQAAYEGLSIEV